MFPVISNYPTTKSCQNFPVISILHKKFKNRILTSLDKQDENIKKL